MDGLLSSGSAPDLSSSAAWPASVGTGCEHGLVVAQDLSVADLRGDESHRDAGDEVLMAVYLVDAGGLVGVLSLPAVVKADPAAAAADLADGDPVRVTGKERGTNRQVAASLSSRARGDYEVPLSDVGDAGSLRASRLVMFSFTSPYGRMWLQNRGVSPRLSALRG